MEELYESSWCLSSSLLSRAALKLSPSALNLSWAMLQLCPSPALLFLSLTGLVGWTSSLPHPRGHVCNYWLWLALVPITEPALLTSLQHSGAVPLPGRSLPGQSCCHPCCAAACAASRPCVEKPVTFSAFKVTDDGGIPNILWSCKETQVGEQVSEEQDWDFFHQLRHLF